MAALRGAAKKGKKMSNFEMPFSIGNKYGDIAMLESYNGSFAICAAQEGRDGNTYKRWAYPARWENKKSMPGEKPMPVKVPIGGDRETAIKFFEWGLKALRGTTVAPCGNPDPVPSDDSDIPF